MPQIWLLLCHSVQSISDSQYAKLDTVREIGKLVKTLLQRNTKLDKIRAEAKMTHVELLSVLSFPSERCDTELAEVVNSFKLKGQLLYWPQKAESIVFDT